MKPSEYNHYIPLQNGDYILYNTLSGAMLIVDKDGKNRIETIENPETNIPQDMLDNLKNVGLIRENNENELLLIRNRYNAKRYDMRQLSFLLSPTAKCNLACGYCWQRISTTFADTSALESTMSESTLQGILSFVKNRAEAVSAHTLPLTFYGGEPLMAKDLVLLILNNLSQWGVEHSVSLEVGFFTNCTLFDQLFIDELQEYAVDSVRTSIDGPQEVHDQYRYYKDGSGTYEKIVTNIGLLQDAGINVVLQYNINRHYEHAPELFDDLCERGLTDMTVDCHRLYDPSCIIQEVKKAYGTLDEDIEVPESQFVPPFKEVNRAKMYVYRAAFNKGFKLHPPKLGLLMPCNGALYYHYVIDPSGDVYKCSTCMLLQSMRVGHIHENGDFERYPFFYEWMDSDPTYIEECQKCDLLPTCGGGCLLGRKLAESQFLCEVSPFGGEEYIKMYLKRKYPEELKFVEIGDCSL